MENSATWTETCSQQVAFEQAAGKHEADSGRAARSSATQRVALTLGVDGSRPRLDMGLRQPQPSTDALAGSDCSEAREVDCAISSRPHLSPRMSNQVDDGSKPFWRRRIRRNSGNAKNSEDSTSTSPEPQPQPPDLVDDDDLEEPVEAPPVVAALVPPAPVEVAVAVDPAEPVEPATLPFVDPVAPPLLPVAEVPVTVATEPLVPEVAPEETEPVIRAPGRSGCTG